VSAETKLATGPKSNVVIVAEFGSDVQSYASKFGSLTFPRPQACPHCAATDHLVGHGSYPRSVVDHVQAIPIRVRRFLCAACRKTISILPTFCLPCRHYQTSTIQTVLDLRFAVQTSWSAIRRRFWPWDVPTPTTCREWVTAFADRSQAYFERLLRQLARWQLAPGKLEVAVDELAGFPATPQRLMAAVPHLVVFLRDNGVGVVEGTARWLSTLWQWGHAVRLGRLV